VAESFPSEYFEVLKIALQHTIYSSKTRGGFVSEVKVADPYWTGEFTTVSLTREELAEWEAFLNECVDRQLSIDFVHPLYPCPVLYNPDTYPGAGTGQIQALVDGRTITVDGLDPSLHLLKGDRISIEQSGRVMYYMLAQESLPIGDTWLTDGDGTILTDGDEDLSVGGGSVYHEMMLTPRLRTGLFTAGATVRVLGAKMRLRISPNSVSFVLQGGQPTAISFNVFEDGR